MNLVNEVKMSLNKILVLPECDEKHLRLQALANIINTMIESCPAPNTSAPQQGQHRMPQLIINNMIKIMYKRGLINDLAKMIHSIELSSSKLPDTVNAVLKPMETLSRAINLATSLHVPAAARPHAGRHPTIPTNSTVPPSSTTATVTDSTAPIQEPTTATNADQRTSITTTAAAVDSTRSTEQQQQQQHQQSTTTDSTLVSTNSENRSSMDSTNANNNNTSLNSANQVLLSISQEELMNATDMEPVAGLPQDVDIFERNIHGTARISTDDDDDEDGDEEASMEDEDEDEDGAVGTINVEFDVAQGLDDTNEHGKSKSHRFRLYIY
jgi:E3 ubiquitin-protein ligase HUWE1